ncbi:MAG: ATP-binding protein [Thiohalomonadales bacterium]
MNWFNQLSIRNKLIVFIMSITLLTMVLAGMAETIFHIKQEKQVVLQGSIALAKLIANRSSAAIIFDDVNQAQENLQSLKLISDIYRACIYKKNETVFSFYQRHQSDDNTCPKINKYITKKTIFHDNQLDVSSKIKVKGETVGYIVITNSLETLDERIRDKIIITILFTIIALLFAYLITNYLQRIISQPLIDVTNTAIKIESEHNYSLRTVVTGNDELGKLSHAFNSMLIMIEEQNQELIHTNITLESQVTKRTEELQSVNSELEAFNYSVSHDLRAPLRAISGFTNIFLEDYNNVLDEDGKDLLNRVVDSTYKMNEIIESLLILSRLDKTVLKYDLINLSEITKSIMKDLEATDSKRKIELILMDNIKVTGDKSLLVVLLENLLGNAWKYSSKCQKTIIEFGTTLVKGERVLYIKDNGAGFDSSNANNLFTPFTRFHRNDEFSGTGIGLATVRRIINRHNGKIWAVSKVNEGATFYFSIPDISES